MMKTNRTTLRPGPTLLALVAGLVFPLCFTEMKADFTPDWVSRIPLGNSLTVGPAGIFVDPDGVSYVTGISGASTNTDITTASFAADGSLRWTKTFDSGSFLGDQVRGLTKSASGTVYVVGNTPGPDDRSNVLILGYDANSGALLKTIQYQSAPGRSEDGTSVVTDTAGNTYVAGHTVGDGVDVATLKFNASGVLQWRQVYDGPASSPFSNDGVVKILLDPSGNVLVAISGNQSPSNSDSVVNKYAATDGALLWSRNSGTPTSDGPHDMEIDAAGDVYLAGTGLESIDKHFTIKFRGSDGQILWQAYDALGIENGANALSLDNAGGVYITGASDPDGNVSNFNDQFFTVKHDAATGAVLWTHVYGQTCENCYDIPTDVHADSGGHVFVVGDTSSPPYNNDVILLVLDAATGLETNRGLLFHNGSDLPFSGKLRFDAAFNIYDGGSFSNGTTGALDMSVTKWASLIAGGGGGIPCGDISSFVARCKTARNGSHRLLVRVTMNDTSHSGEQVTINIDGVPNVVTISGSRAQLSVNNSSAGEHTVELVDPAGCFAPIVTTCE
jgi:hypothetical protein